ncbi:MAG: hypothetical protein DIU62_008385 [Pseudomonadota bacterium]|jgi:hypothetical protein|nr:MAG: hypothetical protein DIU62_10120 [Pseudomonadota bacterium]
MKSPAWVIAAALAFTGAVADAADRKEQNEARLARMLEGRVAGEPVNCITAFRTSGLMVLENVGLVYDAGEVIYVARPRDPEGLGPDDIVIMERSGSQICTTDIIRTIDRATGFHSGVVFIDKFVPYRKAE